MGTVPSHLIFCPIPPASRPLEMTCCLDKETPNPTHQSPCSVEEVALSSDRSWAEDPDWMVGSAIDLLYDPSIYITFFESLAVHP